jgi:hypothetical protein
MIVTRTYKICYNNIAEEEDDDDGNIVFLLLAEYERRDTASNLPFLLERLFKGTID